MASAFAESDKEGRPLRLSAMDSGGLSGDDPAA